VDPPWPDLKTGVPLNEEQRSLLFADFVVTYRLQYITIAIVLSPLTI